MKRLSIRKFVEADRARLRSWRNSTTVAPYMTSQHEISSEEHSQWFSGTSTDRSSRYWICAVDDEPVGMCSINHIDPHNSRADWAMYIGEPAAQGTGLGTCIEYYVLGYSFEVLQLNKLMGEILLRNDKVWKMHLRYGFRKDGQLRDHVRLPSGEFEDMVQISMLRREWADSRKTLEARMDERGLAITSFLDAAVRQFDD